MKYRIIVLSAAIAFNVWFSRDACAERFVHFPIIAQAETAPTAPATPVQVTSNAPAVQKNYIFDSIFYLLLLVASLTAVCRTSRRS